MSNVKNKQPDFDFMPLWKLEEECFLQTTVEGKDSHTGKKVTGSWPRDMPQAQLQYEEWLKKVRDPDTGVFYHKRDKDGNIIKGSNPKHFVKQIVRVRTSDDKEYLYSNGYLLGYNVIGDPVGQVCSNPETWQRTGFAYKKEYDQNQGRVKSRVVGPNSQEIVYTLEFNEKNLKALYEKRITPEALKELSQTRLRQISFALKDERNNTVRDVKDATGIPDKTLELFAKNSFDYLYNGEYITPQQKAELRQQTIDQGLLPAIEVTKPEGQPQTKTSNLGIG